MICRTRSVSGTSSSGGMRIRPRGASSPATSGISRIVDMELLEQSWAENWRLPKAADGSVCGRKLSPHADGLQAAARQLESKSSLPVANIARRIEQRTDAICARRLYCWCLVDCLCALGLRRPSRKPAEELGFAVTLDRADGRSAICPSARASAP